MNGKRKRYPAYRESGVGWLGTIPEDWRALKIKRLAIVKRGASPRPIDDPIYFSDSGSYAWVRISDVTASNKYLLKTEERLSSLGQSRSVALEPGEIFLSIAATVGKPIITKIRCCIHDGFVYFVGLKQDREFLYWLFSSGGLYKGLGKQGTQLNLNTDTIGDIRVPVPSCGEQRAIAAFLDRETAKIDALVAKNERLIELLQEKRTALISHAVTRGLNPNAPLRDSGIPWIGRIPQHWEAGRLKIHLRKIEQGWSPQCENRTAETGEWGVLKVGCMNGQSYDESENKALPPDVPPAREFEVRVGDILMSRSNTIELVGSAGVVDRTQGKILLCDKLYRLVFGPGLEPRYAVQLLRSPLSRKQIEAASSGASPSMKNISNVAVAGLLLPFPPVEEQRAILRDIADSNAGIDTLVTKIRTAIDRLQEYRTALISAAVTGQIDVREAA